MRPLRYSAAAGVLVLVALLFPGAGAAAAPAGSERTTTPIKHFITLMQENHSFDNYFGTYPGADGLPAGTCMPTDPDIPGSPCVEPFPIGGRPVVDLGHSADVFDRQYADGAMDGFVNAFSPRGGTQELPMGYYDDRDIPYYWNIADNYVLFDRAFTSAAGASVWNHFYWVSGSPGNTEADTLRPDGFDHVPTIFDRLQDAGVSWKFYVQNYDPAITFRTPGDGDRASQIIWVPLLNYPRYLDDPEFMSHIVPLDQYYTDLRNDDLPAVSYMVPSGASEHPPGSIQAGSRFVRTLVNALMASSAWDSTAFMWSYDDWGGWYDHVPPPQVDDYGYGFRAPALLVSAYARRGQVNSTTIDFTSQLKFIENNWGLEPLATRDAQANNIVSAFDFDAGPRPPQLLSEQRESEPPTPIRSTTVYALYGAAVAIPGLLVGAAVAGRARRRSRAAAASS